MAEKKKAAAKVNGPQGGKATSAPAQSETFVSQVRRMREIRNEFRFGLKERDVASVDVRKDLDPAKQVAAKK